MSLHRRLPIAGDVLDRLSRQHARRAPFDPEAGRARRARERRQAIALVLLALLVVAAVALTLLVPRSHARPAPTPSTALTHSTLLPGSLTTQPTP